MGPFKPIGVLRAVGFGVREFRLPVGETRFLRVRALAEAQASPQSPPASQPQQ
jgi:hypothetical protein